MKTSTKIFGWLFIIVFFALGAEVVSYFSLTKISFLKHRTYSAPQITEVELSSYFENRHPTLGWPGKEWLEHYTNNRGARISPANDDMINETACISVYGDSFAFAEDVDHDDAWPNILAELVDCPVENFGIGGYGLDQAVLRFESHLQDGHSNGQVSILTVFPDNLNRNVNQWRYLLGSHPLSFKPAFRISGESIEFEPLFSGNMAEFNAITENPNKFLKAETFGPDHDAFGRPTRLSFPYSITALTVAGKLFETYRGDAPKGFQFLANYPGYYDHEHGMSEDKSKIAEYILERFQNSCSRSGKTCLVVLIPDSELVFQQGKNQTHNLSRFLTEAVDSAHFLDATSLFSDLNDYCLHTTRPDNCSGHFSPESYKRLATYIAQFLEKYNLPKLN